MRYFITGANRGIGFGLASRLARRGDEVVATAREPQSSDALRELADETGRVEIHQLDVARQTSVDALSVEGSIDFIINNAGRFSHAGDAEDFDFDLFEKDYQVNTLGPLRVVEALLDNLRASEKKVICNITSNLGSLEQCDGDFYAYRASKAALNMVTRALAADLREDGIIAFVMHPGWVRTDMGGEAGDISVDESVTGIIAGLDDTDASDSGAYRAWDGSTLPW